MGTDPTMSEPTAPTDRANRHALLIVFLVVVIDLLGFGIVLPLLPRYAKDYVDAVYPGQADTWVGGVIIGLLMASFSAMQFVFAPIWGRVSDRIGRRPILLVGLGGSVAFYTLFGYASDMPSQPADAARLALISCSSPASERASPGRPSRRPRPSSPTAPPPRSASTAWP